MAADNLQAGKKLAADQSGFSGRGSKSPCRIRYLQPP